MNIQFFPRDSRKKKFFIFFLFFICLLIVFSLVFLLPLDPVQSKITPSPTKSPISLPPSTKSPTSHEVTNPPTTPHYDFSRSYYDLVYNIKTNMQSIIFYRLPTEYDTIQENPYFLSQVSTSTPTLNLENGQWIKNNTMDFVQPLSGFPKNQVVHNHDPNYPPNSKKEELHLLECNYVFADTKAASIRRMVEAEMLKMAKNTITIKTSFVNVISNKPKSQETHKSMYTKCSAACAKIQCDVKVIYDHISGQLGDDGFCRSKSGATNILIHECGHGLGLDHSDGFIKTGRYVIGKKTVVKNGKSTKVKVYGGFIVPKWTNYNAIQNYGSPISIMGEESLFYDSPAIFRLGWAMNEFGYLQNGKTFALRNMNNYDLNNKDYQALVYICPYTGMKMFFTYNTRINRYPGLISKSTIYPKGPDAPDGSGIFVSLTSHEAKGIKFIDVYTTKEFTIPYGWKFTILTASAKGVTIRTDLVPEKVQYSPSEIDVRLSTISSGKSAVDINIRDATIHDSIFRRDVWPRNFDRSLIKMVSSNGTIFPCETPPKEMAYSSSKDDKGNVNYNFGNGYLRFSSLNEMKCRFTLTSSLKQEQFILTTSIISHSQTKKIIVKFV